MSCNPERNNMLCANCAKFAVSLLLAPLRWMISLFANVNMRRYTAPWMHDETQTYTPFGHAISVYPYPLQNFLNSKKVKFLCHRYVSIKKIVYYVNKLRYIRKKSGKIRVEKYKYTNIAYMACEKSLSPMFAKNKGVNMVMGVLAC